MERDERTAFAMNKFYDQAFASVPIFEHVPKSAPLPNEPKHIRKQTQKPPIHITPKIFTTKWRDLPSPSLLENAICGLIYDLHAFRYVLKYA